MQADGDTAKTRRRARRALVRTLTSVAMAVFVLLAATGMYLWSAREGLSQLRAVSGERLSLYALALEAELARYASLPSLIAADPDLAALDPPRGLSADDRERIGQALARINVRAGSKMLMLLGPDAEVLASSQPLTGGPPPVVPAALREANRAPADAIADFFAANDEDGTTEYYFVHDAQRGSGLVARIVVQVSLSPLEATWVDLGLRSQSEKLLVVDEHNVVVMSSVPKWKYRTLDTVVSAPAMATARYVGAGIETLDLERALDEQTRYWEWRLASRLSPSLHRQLVQEQRVTALSARLVTLLDPSDVVRNARSLAWGGAAAGCALNLLVIYLMYRRRAVGQLLRARNQLQDAHDQLERQVGERTAELLAANEELTRQVARRLQTEDELLQAGKMAVLGQMSAGISHEINQPLTALRALSRNTALLLDAGSHTAVASNLRSIDAMVERMGRIVLQLTSFARRASVPDQPVDLWAAVRNALLLLEHRVAAEQVKILVEVPSGLRVRGESNRIEQVLVNLVTNALDAMRPTPEPRLRISAERRDGRIVTRVEDNGPGMDDAAMLRLFEPFFTTKPAGQGLGLGLVISSKIVREFGGQLHAGRLGEAGGMCFEFDLAAEADAPPTRPAQPSQGKRLRKVTLP